MGTSRSEQRTVRRYVALGDSFTAGAPGGEDEGRWPDELAAALRAANPELDYHNLGEAGVTTAEVARMQLRPCLELRPDLVTVVSGANDVLLSVRPDIEAHAVALDRIFGELSRELPEALVVTGTVPQLANYIDLRPLSRARVERGVRELNEATRGLAAAHGLLCLEFAEHPQAAERENYIDDGFHPSSTGIQRAAHGAAAALSSHFGIRLGQEVCT